ncbi:GNAT family N-acetyltransferase [Geomicrobium sp. JSM 1781026]|uniref:GNAT family N-acetyltransferase n=1 Tax=Geomicrobium sp. JSM 1781026 TaxID=3344580 RepID=UPI0035BF0490
MHIQRATIDDVPGIIRVCTKGYWATYRELVSDEYIERICNEFYNEERVTSEVTSIDERWVGYIVAIEDGQVIGAGGGGMLSANRSEVYVLYLDPDRRNEGIGSKILAEITAQQMNLGATEQWVSVQEGNQKGIPFYEAKGFIYESRVKAYANTEDERYVNLRYRRTIGT